MIGKDTFSWNKIILLLHSEWRATIEEILDKYDFFITTEGRKEFEYRFEKEKDLLDKITIFPVINTELFQINCKKYDPTDSSLLEYSELKGYRIITEDRPLLEEGITRKKNIIQLLDFFYEIYMKDEFLTKREMYHLIKQFRKWKNVKEIKADFYQKRL